MNFLVLQEDDLEVFGSVRGMFAQLMSLRKTSAEGDTMVITCEPGPGTMLYSRYNNVLMLPSVFGIVVSVRGLSGYVRFDSWILYQCMTGRLLRALLRYM